jgi:hypothetical protein
MSGGVGRGRKDAVGETVATYSDYEAAQKAVSRPIASDVPARDIAIVGLGLRSIERVTGRLGYATAARSGAINGVLLGVLFSAVMVLGSPQVPIQVFVGVMLVGIAIGMLLSIVMYSFVRRRRDYASVMQVVADHYDVTVAASSIHKARSVLGVVGAPAPVAPPEPDAGTASRTSPVEAPAVSPASEPEVPEPPRYGERVASPKGPDADAPAVGSDSADERRS